MGLERQHVVVIGGTSGIGLAVAARAAAAGAHVSIGGRDPARRAAACAALSPGVQAWAVDATDRAALDRLFASLGSIDHLVVSVATGGGAGPFRSLDLAAYRAVLDGKLLACLETLQAALPVLRPDGSVTIVTAASARAALPGTVGLAANNGALNAAVPPLAVELAPLRVNAVCPGIVATPIFDLWPAEQRERFFARAQRAPLGRPGRPDEVAQAVLFLMTASYVTGVLLEVDGGLRFTT